MRITFLAAGAVLTVVAITGVGAQDKPSRPPLNVPSSSTYAVSFEGQSTAVRGGDANIAEAMARRPSARQSALLLCYKFGRDRKSDLPLVSVRLHNVALALRSAGGKDVLQGSYSLCRSLSAPARDGRARVEINRVSYL